MHTLKFTEKELQSVLVLFVRELTIGDPSDDLEETIFSVTRKINETLKNNPPLSEIASIIQ